MSEHLEGHMPEFDHEACAGCGHDHRHDDEMSKEALLDELNDMIEDASQYSIVMADEETGEEFTFYMMDDFDYKGEVYVVLLSVDDGDPEAIFARVTDMEDGTEGFETLNDDEYDEIADYYAELCDQAAEDDDDYEWDEEDYEYEELDVEEDEDEDNE